MKLYDNVSKTGLRHGIFPRTFQILEQPLCRACACIFFWTCDVFIVFNNSLLELATHKSTKEDELLIDVPEKGFIGNVSF